MSSPLPTGRLFNPASSADRRRFFIERALRTHSRGSGSNLDRLMASPVPNGEGMFSLDGMPTMLIGAHAAAVYAPPRHTIDIDFVVPFERYAEAQDQLRRNGWSKINDLVFPGSHLGLLGSAWSISETEEKDLMTSDRDWLRDAFAHSPVLRSDGERVIPRDYLILMKMDSARGHDQGDLTRILGRMTDSEVEETISVLTRHLDDGNVAEDVRQYAQIGRWEYESGNLNMDDGGKPNGLGER